MSEAEIVMRAERIIRSQMQQNNELHAQRRANSIELARLQRMVDDALRALESARSLVQSLEEEVHACPNQAHHRGWWTDPSEDL